MALAERARYAARVRFESAKRPAGAKRLGLLALLCACGSGDSSLGLAPPESARAWGAFALEDRSFIASTELMPAGEPLELEADSDREAFVVAWTEFGLRGPIPSPRADDPLRRAAAGELALPAPMAAWRLDGESFEPEKPSSLPPLTRRAQNEGCEALTSQAAFVDSLCSELRCAPRAEWDGCVARLPPGLCTFNRGVTLGVSPEGVALPTGEPSPCVAKPADNSGPVAAFDCSALASACVFEVPGPDSRATFVVERVKVADPIAPLAWHSSPDVVEPWAVGNPLEIAVQADALFMLELDDSTRMGHRICAERGTFTLSRRRLDDLESVSAARSFSECLEGLTPLGSDRLLLIAIDGNSLYLLELDTELRETRRLLLASDVEAGGRVSAVAVALDGSSALVFLERERWIQNPADEIAATRWLIDLGSFVVEAERTEIDNWRVEGGCALPNRTFALSSSGRDSLFFVDLQLGAVRRAEKLTLGKLWFTRPVWDPVAKKLFVPIAGSGGIAAVSDERLEARSATAFEMRVTDFALEPTVVLPNVFGPGKGLAALGYIEGEGAARRHKLAIAPFDGSGPRLGLGRLDLGEGVISQLVDDGRGHAIALLPWTGELLRIRPEP